MALPQLSQWRSVSECLRSRVRFQDRTQCLYILQSLESYTYELSSTHSISSAYFGTGCRCMDMEDKLYCNMYEDMWGAIWPNSGTSCIREQKNTSNTHNTIKQIIHSNTVYSQSYCCSLIINLTATVRNSQHIEYVLNFYLRLYSSVSLDIRGYNNSHPLGLFTFHL